VRQHETIRFTDHPDIHRARAVRALLDQANQLMRSGTYESKDEGVLFRALNACGRQLSRTRSAKAKRSGKDAARYSRLRRELVTFILQQNVGLVYDMLRRTRIAGIDHDELVSEGMWTLLKAITSFDPWRGFRFSTYACTSILRAYVSLGRKKQRDHQAIAALRERAVPAETGVESAIDLEVQLARDRLAKILDTNSAQLTDLERFVIARRMLHDPGVKADTLSQVGEMVELSKERVRQIQLSALGKLGQALNESNQSTGVAA